MKANRLSSSIFSITSGQGSYNYVTDIHYRTKPL
uniref:Uncharacterized protein n=1 Tax=Lepeophtheirus salmonis TaxID=72036 RepID=A0A0K2V6Q5_LEPSM